MKIPRFIFVAHLENGNDVKIMIYQSLTRVDIDLLNVYDFDEDVVLTRDDAYDKLVAALRKATLNDNEISEMIEIIKNMACKSVLHNLTHKDLINETDV